MKAFKLYFLFIAVLLFSSCKKDTVAPKVTPDPSIFTLATPKEGYIKGTATITDTDTTVHANINFTGAAVKSTYEKGLQSTTVIIDKRFAGDGDYFNIGTCILKFNVDSLSSTINVYEKEFTILLKKRDDTAESPDDFLAYKYSNGSSPSVSNVVYNASTKVISGNFSVTIPADGTFGKFQFDGSFSSKIYTVK